MNRLRTTLWLVLLACISSTALMAQANSGSLSGVVTDPNGALVPGARVVATNTSSGLRAETVTSDGGLYVFPSLPVGFYDVSVEIAGFKKVTQSNIEIRVATRQELNPKLEV